MKMSGLDLLVFLLVVVGGLNWGLVGLFEYNLVDSLLGAWPMVVRLVYVLVGLAALYMLAMSPSKSNA
jgi:uncharacterized membrane protein YuzA (DUF378 family)